MPCLEFLWEMSALQSKIPIDQSKKAANLTVYSTGFFTVIQYSLYTDQSSIKGQEISKAFFIETPSPKKRLKLFKGFLP